MPGTSCDTTAPVPYCHAAGDARDDGYQVDRDSAGTNNPGPLDVLANDTLSESACIDPNMTILSICGDGVTEQYETDHPDDCADDAVKSGTPVLTPGGTVTYDSPDDGKCGFVDTFTYTVDLGGGVIDTAIVRVLVACVCGDSVVDSNEQCDRRSNNGAAGTINTHGTVDPSDDTYYRCGDSCLYNVFCGDGYIVFPEEAVVPRRHRARTRATAARVPQCSRANAPHDDCACSVSVMPQCADVALDGAGVRRGANSSVKTAFISAFAGL